MPIQPDKSNGTKPYVSGYSKSLGGPIKRADGQHPATLRHSKISMYVRKKAETCLTGRIRSALASVLIRLMAISLKLYEVYQTVHSLFDPMVRSHTYPRFWTVEKSGWLALRLTRIDALFGSLLKAKI